MESPLATTPDAAPTSTAAGTAAPPATTATPTVLRVGPLMPQLEQELIAEFDAPVISAVASELTGEQEAQLADVRVVVTGGRFGVSRALMERLPSLEAIVNFGVGYDTTDTSAARELGIALSNTPDVLNDCVADTAMSLLLDVYRGISTSDRYVRAGSWKASGNFPLTTRFTGTRVGIVGLGRIGSAIAKRLSGFGCPISYHNRREVPGSPFRYVDSLVELARSNDALVVAAAGGADSQKLISAEVLEALGTSGVLVNISRGSVVDEDALVSALQAGTIRGAGLDVFADEPNVPDALIGLENVVLLPHLGSGTRETRDDMRQLVVDNLRSWLAHGTLVTPVEL
ncbi:2-hydroxyacid dehydrogenase [Pseudoclavibacter sp. RFBA6]|uniref:2-hydroxyacid dehydrogenase n=1 Tax=Pseudoclavibacter sp. RFBA6 TaxID=2080573 RepID=UPI000CE81066|nr:2-hydroxyacid dehydrogenase [Pseudoclavibacter sp. RFBA6]PPG40545.1 hydroxyacid dehydrogenase [Pseudoclavibacter sp. RFBA6]